MNPNEQPQQPNVTNIHVTQHVQGAPRDTPRFGAASAATAQQGSPQTGQTVSQKVTRRVQHIHWGNVVKGALIVAAVVAVAVVGAGLVSSGVGTAVAAAGQPGALGMAGTAINSLAAGAHFVFDAAWGAGHVVWAGLSGFVQGIGTGFGVGAAAAPLAASAVPAATTTGIAGWLSGITATAMALPLALKQIFSLNLMDSATVTTVTGPDMAAAPTTAAQTAQTAHFVTPDAASTHAAHAGTTADAALHDSAASAGHGEHELSEALLTTGKVMKVVHHAAEEEHEHAEHLATAALASGRLASQQWVDRLHPRQQQMGQQQTMRSEGIASRSGKSFAENVAADEARQQALADGGRA